HLMHYWLNTTVIMILSEANLQEYTMQSILSPVLGNVLHKLVLSQNICSSVFSVIIGILFFFIFVILVILSH
ncbi:hypothetical protein ACJX0J_022390, partial [Zea mays]